MFGALSSSAGAGLVDRQSFDAVANLIAVVRNPGKAQELLEELLVASADAKKELDQLQVERSALAGLHRDACCGVERHDDFRGNRTEVGSHELLWTQMG